LEQVEEVLDVPAAEARLGAVQTTINRFLWRTGLDAREGKA